MQCYIRMEKGEPPSEDIEREWEKMTRNEERKTRDMENIKMVGASLSKVTSHCQSDP